MKKTIELKETHDFLVSQGYAPIPSFKYGYVTKDGRVARVLPNGGFRYCLNREFPQGMRTSIRNVATGKTETKVVARLVYETFVGEITEDIIYIDGNKNNPSLENLTTVSKILDTIKRHDLLDEIKVGE